MVENKAITNMDQDFAQWYTDVVKKAELTDYSAVKGFMILRPYGYAIWELIQRQLDDRLKATGHQNVYLPMLIPESLLQKEKDHVEGFAPEVAWITRGGSEPLTEPLCIRPTSETLFCSHYADIIQSYRDLPKLYNQWCSVVRWEKTTRPFLRTREFLWQEGHTAHATAEEAQKETIDVLDIYASFCENILAMPVVKGRKTESEKFAGAVATYTIESMMHDGKALQSGTTHFFGDGFARAFNVQFTDKNNELKYVYQTSWGVTTRLIGGLIMVHGDSNGLKLPPNIAPIQVMVIPVAMHKEGVTDACLALKDRLAKAFRTDIDLSDKSPGWKYSEQEVRGIPLRVELGPKDIEKGQAVAVRRDTGEKIIISLDDPETEITKLLQNIQADMLEKARQSLSSRTYDAHNLDEFAQTIKEKPGFIKAMYCGDEACEDKIKELTGATPRCMPFDGGLIDTTKIDNKCVCCGKEANDLVVWGQAY